MEFVTFNQIFSIFFVFGGHGPRSHRGLCQYGLPWWPWRNPLFCPPPKQIPGYATVVTDRQTELV